MNVSLNDSAAANPDIELRLQSPRPVGRVAELGSFGKTMKVVYFVAIALLAIRPAFAADKPAFAADSYYHLFPKGPLSHVEHRWYATHLAAMKEPVLALPADDKDYFAFRILHSPTWGRPIALRIERKGGTIERRAVMLSGESGYLGEIKEEKRTAITKSELATLLEDIRKSGFWELSPDDDVMGADGCCLIIEAIQDGRHGILVRWTPEHDTANRGLSGLVAFYTRLFQKAGLGEALCFSNQ